MIYYYIGIELILAILLYAFMVRRAYINRNKELENYENEHGVLFKETKHLFTVSSIFCFVVGVTGLLVPTIFYGTLAMIISFLVSTPFIYWTFRLRYPRKNKREVHYGHKTFTIHPSWRKAKSIQLNDIEELEVYKKRFKHFILIKSSDNNLSLQLYSTNFRTFLEIIKEADNKDLYKELMDTLVDKYNYKKYMEPIN